MENIGLYIHIPFCKSKCHYCDFNSRAGMEEFLPAYFEALEKEAAFYSGRLGEYIIKTVFIGGGTPSLAPSGYIRDLMNFCTKKFHIAKDAEITLESNPGTLSYEKLTAYRISGINRLSIGLQASQDRLLKTLGRTHTFEEFVENYCLAKSAGFKDINVDLMFGIPGQTLYQWKDTLEKVMELNPAHLSCYSLKIEEDTPFGQKYEKGELTPLEDELDREMYYLAIEKLAQKGYWHYEISNFARQGRECRHNLIYWKAEEYLGLGAGAHSYLEGKRYNNCYDISRYMNGMDAVGNVTENEQEIDRLESIQEYMILGLRLVDGIREEDFEVRYGEKLFTIFGEQIRKLEKRGLLEFEEGRLHLSSQGLDVANEVFMEFI